jgi:recombination protein RecA
MQRPKLNQPFSDVKRVPSGSTLLDQALGGGWALGRIINVVGDRSTGKTLQAIEGLANFNRLYPKGRKRYGEAEAAFDDGFAKTLGFPDGVERPSKPLETVEEFYTDLEAFSAKKGPALYVLDSLDALSDNAEMGRELGEDSYGTGKAKQLSQMFRRITRQLEANDCGLMIISQLRDRIGVMFGETKMRAGGRALDFYASQVVWLAELHKIERTVKFQKRPYGVRIRANVKKCKVGTPYRTCDYDLIFGYGVDDEQSMVQWLGATKTFDPEMVDEIKQMIETARARQDRKALNAIAENLKLTTRETWAEIEQRLAPSMRKY